MPTPLSEPPHPLLELGQLVMTPGITQMIEREGFNPSPFIDRHRAGDWGDLSPIDRRVNQDALRTGARILSCYQLGEAFSEASIWILTEAGRYCTTLLLPHEY